MVEAPTTNGGFSFVPLKKERDGVLRALLTESQRKKYGELLKKRGERGRGYHRGNREKEKAEAHETLRGGG